MSALAQIIGVVFALWFAASVCYALQVPRIHTFLERLNWFATFSRWQMFSPPEVPGWGDAYRLEYRDRRRESPSAWIVAAATYHGHPAGFILNTRRPITEALQRLGRVLERRSHWQPTENVAAALLRCEVILEGYVARQHPRRHGEQREIRLVNDRGREGLPESVVWSFTAHDSA
jgi:hypothetical protein